VTYTVVLSASARKDLKKISNPDQARILDFLEDRVQNLDDPRQLGKTLVGKRYKGLWRYRVGDYRIFARIKDNVLTITVIEISHRKNIYR